MKQIPKQLKTEPLIEAIWQVQFEPVLEQPEHNELVNYQPKTALGKRLFALRQAHIAKGGRLLNAAEIDEELKLRRGGVNA